MLRTFKLALSNLTARQAQILDAVDIYGTHDKAAAALGVKLSTVSNTIYQIRKKLSKRLEKTGEEG